MFRLNTILVSGLIGYLAGAAAWIFLPAYISIGVPVLVATGTYFLIKSSQKRKPLPAQEAEPIQITNPSPPVVSQQEPEPLSPEDTEWQQVNEYIGTIEDMVILEGKQHNLDDEIVEKTLTLLSRLNRVIPQLRALNDSSINHNVKRLVLRDLNGVITPFLSLGGEAKQKNRRLLLNGLKDIDSKMTFYTETIEQKDLLELKTKAELIRQRYHSGNI
ncbi:hypothetical protein D3C73_625670 [compost metagenome]